MLMSTRHWRSDTKWGNLSTRKESFPAAT
jgi:hypothetical protein